MNFEEELEAIRAILGRAEWDEARRAIDHAESLASDEPQHALVAMHRASIPVLRQDPNPDLRVFRENIVRRHSPRHVFMSAYYILIHAIQTSDRVIAERYLAPFVEAARQRADPYYDNLANEIIATVESMRGDHDAAIERQRAALASLDSYEGDDALLLRTTQTHNLAYNCLAANRLDEALQHAHAALALGESVGRADYLGHILLTAAFANLCSERLDAVEDLTERAARFVAGTRYERYIHYLRGELARRRGDVFLASEHFEKLEELYPEIPGVAEILLSLNVAPFLLPE